jgi:hypothetical protein
MAYTLSDLENIAVIPRDKTDMADAVDVVRDLLEDRGIELTEELWQEIAQHLDPDDFYSPSGGGSYTVDPDRREDRCIEAVHLVCPPKVPMPYHINENGAIPCTNCHNYIFINPNTAYPSGAWEWLHLRTRKSRCFVDPRRGEVACPQAANDDGGAWYS